MSRIHQITEEDLSDLERTLPDITSRLWTPDLDNRTRVQLRRVQSILSNVRWDYGPPSEVIIIPAGDDNPPKTG